MLFNVSRYVGKILKQANDVRQSKMWEIGSGNHIKL